MRGKLFKYLALERPNNKKLDGNALHQKLGNNEFELDWNGLVKAVCGQQTCSDTCAAHM